MSAVKAAIGKLALEIQKTIWIPGGNHPMDAILKDWQGADQAALLSGTRTSWENAVLGVN
jgi:hypothetical protein